MGKHLGRKVKFAKHLDPMAKYSAIEEADADDELDSLDGIGVDREDGNSPRFPDEWNRDRVLWDQRLRKIQRVAWIQGMVIAVLMAYVVVLQFHLLWPKYEAVPLGVDPSGFVPPDIGQPVRWMKYDDESDPHYFKPDVFDSLDKVQAAAREFKMMHNASNVRINGKYTTYMDFNDEKQPLPAYVTRKGSELYSIRAFHQMHCVSIIFEDIGYRVLNKTSKWATGHVIHCLNTVRSAITCLADATPISYVNGMGVGHTTDDQQSHCRDFFALREWAHDPVRAVQWVNVAPDDEKDRYEEIVP
ncbi:Cyclochlorotine biosynthesis protein R [Colletotrichum spinosum]|uniref:Cyclochlorotine biosynthesis protein R n=1 Tax=Colletotrichum spinosum TaxID=1347390 RepID=A0A4R8Q315_9PEZI|nr:Cyclochlorotine biosynthesis protein R [Colletotrichum spinosum]